MDRNQWTMIGGFTGLAVMLLTLMLSFRHDMEQLSGRIDELSERVSRIGERFASIEERFASIEGRVSRIEGLLEGLIVRPDSPLRPPGDA